MSDAQNIGTDVNSFLFLYLRKIVHLTYPRMTITEQDVVKIVTSLSANFILKYEMSDETFGGFIFTIFRGMRTDSRAPNSLNSVFDLVAYAKKNLSYRIWKAEQTGIRREALFQSMKNAFIMTVVSLTAKVVVNHSIQVARDALPIMALLSLSSEDYVHLIEFSKTTLTTECFEKAVHAERFFGFAIKKAIALHTLRRSDAEKEEFRKMTDMKTTIHEYNVLRVLEKYITRYIKHVTRESVPSDIFRSNLSA